MQRADGGDQALLLFTRAGWRAARRAGPLLGAAAWLGLALAACATPRAPAPPPIVATEAAGLPDADGAEAWDALTRALPGRWVATLPGGKEIGASYRLMANGSALVETYGSRPERETLSVYHRDGLALVMTHYCGQGNQARLRAREASATRVVFTLEAATNVSEGMSVMSELVFVLGEGTLERTEVYVGQGAPPERTVLAFRRVAKE